MQKLDGLAAYHWALGGNGAIAATIMSDHSPSPEYTHAVFPDRPGPAKDERETRQWSTIYFLFGQAVFRAQAYEDAIAEFIIMAEQRDSRTGLNPEGVRKLTLGALQKHYCRFFVPDHRHDTRMAEARKARNSLAHGFYRTRMNLLETTGGRDRVINELQQVADLLQSERDDVYWNRSLLTGEAPL